MQTGPGFFPTFLYYFVTTFLLMTLVSSQGLGISISTGVPPQIGLVLGLLAGIAGGYFYRTVTLSQTFEDKQKFVAHVTGILADMGYSPAPSTSDGDELTVYQRPFPSRLFSGKVYVQTKDDTANISSRSIHISGLKKQL